MQCCRVTTGWRAGTSLHLISNYNKSQEALEIGCVCQLHMKEQWHYWIQPFQCIRQNGDSTYSDALWLTTRILKVSLSTWIIFLIFVIKLYFNFSNMLMWQKMTDPCWIGYCLRVNGEIFSGVQISLLTWNDLLSHHTCVTCMRICTESSQL